ncbi:hypothetical protein DPMN_055337 [Dreissena polymorpha]|uniref:Uncharacterized protein n=1 Tax=Dreissena polymorpha TaxID=45954 RepID=A0A9D4HS66_DREPO|nr:hypothetical protein DPMN_055337 [Dreissena polymorpha]
MSAIKLTASRTTSVNVGHTTDRISNNLRQCRPYNRPYLAKPHTMPAVQLTVSCKTAHSDGLTTDRNLQSHTMPAIQLTASLTTSENAGLTTDRILHNLRQ